MKKTLVFVIALVLAMGMMASAATYTADLQPGWNFISVPLVPYDSSVAAVFGGIGSIPGAVIGAFLIGIVENIIKGVGWTTFSDAFTFVLLVVILMVKPTGIFGEKKTDKV